ncbi:MAG: hypothetical protein KA479_13330 [Saprospiraceae bacterium]|nr:hypothetical protein [Saprospiraceae bacterium]
MSMFEQVRLIIYRIKEKGLEIFLVNAGEGWELPEITESPSGNKSARIELEPVRSTPEGSIKKAVAIEGDWHDIPSLKKLLGDDVVQIKDHLTKFAPEMDQGTFFALSDALRKVTPDYNAFIKELKDIIRDRNSVKYM